MASVTGRPARSRRSPLPLHPPLVPSPAWAGETLAEPPLGLLALWLAAWAEDGGTPVVHVARGERRARLLTRALASLLGRERALPFPALDSLPYDRVPASRGAIGRRWAALSRLGDGLPPGTVVLASVEAVVQRVGNPPGAARVIAVGDALDPEELGAWLEAHGYDLDERVDEPGEAALRGAVADLFPAGAEQPCRLDLADGRVAAIRSFDPLTQRGIAGLEGVSLDPAEETVQPEGGTLLDRLPGARLVLDAELVERHGAFLELVREAHAARAALRRSEAAAGAAEALPPPDRLYLDEGAWDALVAGFPRVALRPAEEDRSVPTFRSRANPAAAFAGFVRDRLAAGDRVVLTVEDEREERRLLGLLGRGAVAERLTSWRGVEALAAGALGTLRAALPTGFAGGGVAAVAAADVLSPRARRVDAALLEARFGIGSLRPGDLVVHARHGVARLRGLEAVATGEEARTEHLVLEYAGERRLLVPVLELDQVWRYGTAEAEVGLDRIDGEDWGDRCRRIEAEVAAAAAELARLAEERQALPAPALRPPRDAMARFARRFPYEPTEDQAAAIEATLADLARGAPPMDRLVVGDVGFGKTEVALRAAAAAALCGKQVALLAPTTLLARQHLQTFRRRFAGFGVRVGQLSRLARTGEAREVRAGLADGSVQVVIGTHALASPQLRFKDLALAIVDEEQRFGARHKEALRRLKHGVHTLTMSATPIPRTLQSALAGVREASLIATPPVRRRPVRTFVLPFEPGLVREALERERRRGGRSFVVVPRIADLEPMRERLEALAPGFDVVTAHGRMKAEDLDAAVLAFADGEHDVLLTTSIVETGLDIPGANTMIVWRADRFGVGQLHQLRGRVGRGRERAACYLLHDPDEPLSPASEQRLRTLAAFEDLGAGFLISLKDLDLRGAGDLAGDEQSGHVRRVGTGLYQEMLARALRRARGEEVPEPFSPELELGVAAFVPEDYVPEPELRLDLYGRLARLDDPEGAEDLAAEITDRFGPPPEPVAALLELAALRAACRRLGVARLEAGAKAAAATFRDAALLERHAGAPGLRRSGERLLLDRSAATAAERLAAARELLNRLTP